MTQETKTPSIPAVTSVNLAEVAKAVKELLEVREGLRGDPLDQVVTHRELVQLDLAGVSLTGGARGTLPTTPIPIQIGNGSGAGDGYDPALDLTTPPQPEDVVGYSGYETAQLRWSIPLGYKNPGFAEVWRSTSNVLGSATLVGRDGGWSFTDRPGVNSTFYYWVRFVSAANVTGPWHDTSGIEITTSFDIGSVITALAGQISATELDATLTSRINLIDATGTGLVTKVSGLEATYGSTASAAASAASAAQALADAITAKTSAQGYASQASSSKVSAEAANTSAQGAAAAAASSSSSAASYKTAAEAAAAASSSAKVSAESARDAASGSAAAAANSASTAATKATDAGTSAAAAQTAQTAAETARSSAQTSATNASTSATNAGGSATSAANSASQAAASATAAGGSASAAAGSASSASTQATNAGNSATAANTARVAAESARDAAAGSASAAATSASSASTSATAAGTSASSATSAANTATTQAANAQTYASSAATSATNADGSAQAAASSVNALKAVATGFDAALVWNFDSTVEGWTAVGASQSAASGNVTLTSSGSDPQFLSPVGLAIAGALNTIVRARVKRVSGTGWDGSLTYSTAGHGISTSYRKTVTPDPTSTTEWRVVEWDMSTLTAGGTDWTSNTITQLRIDLGSTASDVFLIDWVTVGRIAPVAVTAALAQEASVRASTDGALQAQWTVKTDTAGLISGFGLASTANNAAPSSAFGVRANQFYLAPPAVSSATAPTANLFDGFVWLDTSTTPNVTRYRSGTNWVLTPPALPFIVQTTPTTINGQAVPPGVYVQQAFIANGTIGKLQVGLAVIDTAHVDKISADKLDAGTIAVGRYIGSNNYVAGTSGWRINGDGTAQFTAASIVGKLVASQIDTRGLDIRDTLGNVILQAGTSLTYVDSQGRLRGAANEIAVKDSADLVSMAGWTLGTSLPWTGLGLASENSIVSGIGPRGVEQLLWRAIASGDSATSANWDGGFYNDQVSGFRSISTTKRYRVIVPVKRVSTSAAGTIYAGISPAFMVAGEERVFTAAGVRTNNPYIANMAVSAFPQGVWCALVGEIFPNGTSNPVSTIEGIYRLDSMAKIGSANGAYSWTPQAGTLGAGIRAGLYGAATAGVEVQFAAPILHVVDGTEPMFERMFDVAPAVLNSQITLSSDGTLSGGGGGQVTISGLGYVGSLNATSDLTLVPTGTVTVSGNSVSKGSGSATWDSQVYSKEAYKGGAYVTFTVGALKAFMVGLNSDPTTDASFGTLDFAWYIENSGTCQIRVPGATAQVSGLPCAVGDVMSIIYDGSRVMFIQNNTLQYSHVTNVTPDLMLFLDSSFNAVGSAANNIRFGPISNNSWQALGGTGKPRQFSAYSRGASATSYPSSLTLGVRDLDSNVQRAGNVRSYSLLVFNRITGDALRLEYYDVYAGAGSGNTRPANLALWSQGFDNSIWAKSAATISGTLVVAPDGTTTGQRIVETATNTNHGVSLSSSLPTASAGQMWTASIYVKPGERSVFYLWIDRGDGNGVTVEFKTTTQTTSVTRTTAGAWDTVTSAIDSTPANGWYRLSVTARSVVQQNVQMRLFLGDGSFTSVSYGTPLYAGSTASGAYIWGAQLEPANGVRTYRATTTAARYLDAQALAEDLNAATPDELVVITTWDEPQANRMTGGLPDAIYRCGGSPAIFGSPNFQYRAAYILIGVPGCGQGNGYESYCGSVSGDTKAWCATTFSYQNGLWNVSGTSATPGAITDYGYTGDLDATNGAPAGTLVAGVAAATVATAATNFNASNDRNAAAVPTPTITSDGTAVDHVAQADGSVDLSFEWAWAGTEGDIDGFLVYVRQATSSAAYTFGATPAEETVYTVPANKRAFILFGVAANKFYHLGVCAYRAVDKDINSSGVIKSSIVKPALAAENPYQPATSVAFSGNVTGTVNGVAATDVNVWTKISGAGKPADNATAGPNLIRKATFEDGQTGGWGTVTNNVTGQDWTKSLSIWVRDVEEVGGEFPVVAGETLYVACNVSTSGSGYTAGLGVRFINSAGGTITWSRAAANPANTGWMRQSGTITVPAGAVMAVPWVQIDGPGSQTLNSCQFANLYIGRQQLGATVGADWASNVTGIPYETIFNNDDSVALGFNPTFAWPAGASYPTNWTNWSGTVPTKETSLVRVGSASVRYAATGGNVGMQRQVTFTSSPLPAGTFLAGTIDMHLVAYTSGKPGVLVRVFTNAALSTYTDTQVTPPNNTVGSWQRVPWTARVGAGQQIYGIYIYLMGSWTSMSGGAFTGTVVFDNLRFMLADATTDNKALTLVDNNGVISVSGSGGGTVSAVTTNNKVNNGNIGAYVEQAGITDLYIGNFIQSKNFDGAIDSAGNITANGAAGWAIGKGGKAVLNNVFVRGSGVFQGDISGSTGTFAGALAAGVVDLQAATGVTRSYPNAGVYEVYTLPWAGTVRFTLVGAGGGGGGGGGNAGNGGVRAGNGGAAGSVVTMTINNVPAGTSITVNIGSGGAGATSTTNPAAPNSGSSGGTTSITIGSSTYSAAGGAGGAVLTSGWRNAKSIVYHCNDYGDGAVGYTSAGDAAGFALSVGGQRGATSFGNDVVFRGASSNTALLDGSAGSVGGGGGGGAPSNLWVGSRGFYIDPVDGEGGDGNPTTRGGRGGDGYAMVEIFNPNGVILRTELETLKSNIRAGDTVVPGNFTAVWAGSAAEVNAYTAFGRDIYSVRWANGQTAMMAIDVNNQVIKGKTELEIVYQGDGSTLSYVVYNVTAIYRVRWYFNGGL